jgi:hypothetical protein
MVVEVDGIYLLPRPVGDAKAVDITSIILAPNPSRSFSSSHTTFAFQTNLLNS